MITSHILTDEEVEALAKPILDKGYPWKVQPWVYTFAKSIEAAVIAKLSGWAVLPEPAYQRLSDLQSGIDSYYTASQMHEAFAQGAASQLSAEPAAQVSLCNLEANPDGTEWCREVLLYSPKNEGDKLRGINTRAKLYTRKGADMKLPEPVALIYLHTASPLARYYTEAQLMQAIDDALEAAALLCDAEAASWRVPPVHHFASDASRHCAEAIRGMKEQT